MRLGIFARTFSRPTLEQVLDAVQDHGLDCVQFNMVCAGLPPMPDELDPSTCERIYNAFQVRGMTMAAVSGTFNMIHPDPQVRAVGLRRLATLAAACKRLGTRVVTLCTGTRNPENMWRPHPENGSPEAWRDLLETMEAALDIASQHDVFLGVEPEVSNVVDSAVKARSLLDEMRSPQLRIIIDGANLFPAGTLPRQREILEEAFDLLGPAIVIAHAKDLSHDGEAGHEAAGTGLLNYDLYLALLRRSGFDGPLILHSLAESQVEQSVKFLRQRLTKPS